MAEAPADRPLVVSHMCSGLRALDEAAAVVGSPAACAGRSVELNLHGNELTHLRHEADLSHVTSLTVSSNSLCHLDGSALAGMPRLRHLDAAANGMTSVHSMAEATSLRSLCLAHNNITSLSFLRDLASPRCHLAELDLRDNALVDVRALAHLGHCQGLANLRLQDKDGSNGNPLCAHPAYTSTVLSLCPALQVLDGVPVTDRDASALPPPLDLAALPPPMPAMPRSTPPAAPQEAAWLLQEEAAAAAPPPEPPATPAIDRAREAFMARQRRLGRLVSLPRPRRGSGHHVVMARDPAPPPLRGPSDAEALTALLQWARRGLQQQQGQEQVDRGAVSDVEAPRSPRLVDAGVGASTSSHSDSEVMPLRATAPATAPATAAAEADSLVVTGQQVSPRPPAQEEQAARAPSPDRQRVAALQVQLGQWRARARVAERALAQSDGAEQPSTASTASPPLPETAGPALSESPSDGASSTGPAQRVLPLAARLGDMPQRLAAAEAARGEAEDALRAATERLQAAAKSITALKAAVAQERQRASRAEAEAAQSSERADRAEEALSRAPTHAALAKETLRAELAEAAAARQQASAEAAAERREAAEGRARELGAEVEAAHAQARQADETLRAVTERRDRAEATLARLEATRVAELDSHRALTESLLERLAGVQGAAGEATAAKRKAQATAAAAVSRAEDAEAALRRAKRDAQHWQRRAEQAEATAAAAVTAAREAADARIAAAAATAEEEVRRAAASSSDTLARLRRSFEEVAGRCTVLEAALRKAHAAHSAAKQAGEEAARQTKRQAEEAQRAQQEAQAAREALAKARGEEEARMRAECRDELAAARDAASASAAQAHAMERQLQEVRSALHEEQEQCQRLAGELKVKGAMLADQASALGELKRAVQAAKEEAEMTEGGLRDALNDVRREADSSRRRLREVQEASTAAEAAAKRASEENAALRRALATMQEALTAARKAADPKGMEELQQQVAAKEAALTFVEQEVASLQDMFTKKEDKLRADLHEAQQEAHQQAQKRKQADQEATEAREQLGRLKKQSAEKEQAAAQAVQAVQRALAARDAELRVLLAELDSERKRNSQAGASIAAALQSVQASLAGSAGS